MSLLYRILKPIVRKVVKGGPVHQEESYEAFKQASYDVQRKFRFALPRIREGMPHAWPVFTFLPERREGEWEIIADIKGFFHRENSGVIKERAQR